MIFTQVHFDNVSAWEKFESIDDRKQVETKNVGSKLIGSRSNIRSEIQESKFRFADKYDT